MVGRQRWAKSQASANSLGQGAEASQSQQTTITSNLDRAKSQNLEKAPAASSKLLCHPRRGPLSGDQHQGKEAPTNDESDIGDPLTHYHGLSLTKIGTKEEGHGGEITHWMEVACVLVLSLISCTFLVISLNFTGLSFS